MIAQILGLALSIANAQGPAIAKQSVVYQIRFLIDGRLVANTNLSTENDVEVASPAAEPFKIRLKPTVLASGEIRTEGSVSYEAPGAKFNTQFRFKSRSGESTGLNDTGGEHTYQLDLSATLR